MIQSVSYNNNNKTEFKEKQKFSIATLKSIIPKLRKRITRKKIALFTTLIIIFNILLQGMLFYGLSNAEFQVIDIRYGGNYSSFSVLNSHVLVINHGSTPIFVPKLRLEIYSHGDIALELETSPINVPGNSMDSISIIIKIYHNQAAKKFLKTLIEEGRIAGDIKVYFPVTLFGTIIVGYIPITISESTLTSILSGFSSGGSARGGGETQSTSTQSTGYGAMSILGILAYSIQYSGLHINDLKFVGETEDYAETIISLSGGLPEVLRDLGNISIERFVMDLVSDDFGHILSLMIYPTVIVTASGNWNTTMVLRIYKQSRFGEFIKYVIEKGSLPSGRITITTDIKIFDIELKDLEINIDLSSISGTVTSAAVNAKKDNKVSVSQSNHGFSEIVNLIIEQNQDFLFNFMMYLSQMFGIANLKYLGYNIKDSQKEHLINIYLNLNNIIGWTFGFRNLRISFETNNGASIIMLEHTEEEVVNPYTSKECIILAKVFENDELKNFFINVLSSSKIAGKIRIQGDIRLLNQWIEDISIEIPLEADLSSFIGNAESSQSAYEASASNTISDIDYKLASAVFSLFTAGRYRTSQIETLVPGIVKHIRIGSLDAYEEKGFLKICIKLLYEMVSLPFAIDDLSLDVYYRATHLMSIYVPSFDLRPSGDVGFSEITRKEFSLIISLNEDNPYISSVVSDIIAGKYDFVKKLKISGTADFYIFGAKINNIPLRFDGGMLYSMLVPGSSESTVKSSEENVPTFSIIPFPVELGTVLPPELFQQLVKIIDITTEPTVIVDGVPVYTMKIIVELNNPTSITMSIKKININLLKKVNSQKKPVSIMSIYLEKPLVVLPGDKDVSTIVVKMIANEGLKITLNELLQQFKLDVILNQTISITIGRLSLENIKVETEFITEIPEPVIAGAISSIISAFQQYLTVEELLNLLIPQEVEEEKTINVSSAESSQNSNQFLFGNPVIEYLEIRSMEYENNATFNLHVTVSNVTIPFELVLKNVTIIAYYGDFINIPIMKLTLYHRVLGEDKHDIELNVVIFKGTEALKDFILDIFRMKGPALTLDLYADISFLNFQFSNITIKGISVTLPEIFTPELSVNIPYSFLSQILGLSSESSNNAEMETASTRQSSQSEIVIPQNFLQISDIEYLGMADWRGYEAYHVRVNITFLNLFNLTLGISNSTIEIFRGDSLIPSIAIFINGTYDLDIGILNTIQIDAYVINTEEAGLLLNEIINNDTLNITVKTDLNLVILGVEVDGFSFTTFILAETRDVISTMIENTLVGMMQSSSSSQTKLQVANDGNNLDLIPPELISEILQMNVTGIVIEEYKDVAYISLSAKVISKKLEFTVDNITVDIKLSEYDTTLLRIFLRSPIHVLKNQISDANIRLAILKKDMQQLDEFLTTLVNFGVMTIDVNITVDIEIFNARLTLPLELKKLTVNISEILGYDSLQDFIWESFSGEENSESTVESAAASDSEGSGIPLPINFDLGAILAMFSITQLITPVNVTFLGDELIEDGATVYSLFLKVKITNPFKLNLTVKHSVINVVKNDYTLISFDIQESFIPEMGEANVTMYVKFYYWPTHDYTGELLQSLIDGEAYDVNISGAININILGVDLPTISIVLPLNSLLGFSSNPNEALSKALEENSNKDVTSEIFDFLSSFQTVLGVLLASAQVNLTEFSIKEEDTKTYTHIVMKLGGIKSPITIYDINFAVNYTSAPYDDTVLKISLSDPLDLDSDNPTLNLSIIVYKNNAMEDLLNKLLHENDITISVFGNITVKLFTDAWKFNVTISLENISLNINSLFPEESESSGSQESSSSETTSNTNEFLVMPTFNSEVEPSVTLSDIISIVDVTYLGTEKVNINGFEYQKHKLRILVKIDNKLNITIGWSGAVITCYNEYGLPVLNILLTDVLVKPLESMSFYITAEIYDTPYVKDLLEKLISFSGIYLNVSFHFDSLIVMGIAISDIDFSIPINTTTSSSGSQGSTTQASSSFDMTSLLSSMILIDESQLLEVLPPIDIFFSDIKVQDVSLYTEYSNTVLELKLKVNGLVIPLSIGKLSATIYYPAMSDNPILGLEISSDESNPTNDLTITAKVIAYGISPAYSSEALYKLLHGEKLIVKLLSEVKLSLFGSQIQGVPSYLTLDTLIEFDNFEITGIDLSSIEVTSSSSSNDNTGSNSEDFLSSVSNLVNDIFSQASGFLMDIVKIGNLGFAVVDESDTYVELKLGAVLKIPIDLTIVDLDIHLSENDDILTEFASVSLDSTADFIPNEWSVIYLRVRLLKNQYLQTFFENLLYDWKIAAYASLRCTLKLDDVIISNLEIRPTNITIKLDPNEISKFLASNTVSGGTTVDTSGDTEEEKMPQLTGVPGIGFDLASVINKYGILSLGYGNWYDPNDIHGGIKQLVDSGRDYSGAVQFDQPWINKMLIFIKSSVIREYRYYLISGVEYHVSYEDIDGADKIYIEIIRPDGTTYTQGLLTSFGDYHFTADQTGFWIFKFHTDSTSDVKAYVTLEKSGAQGYVNPWYYNWIVLGVSARLREAFPGIRISSLLANIYYNGMYYTVGDDGIPVPTGVYANGDENDFLGEIYIKKLEINPESEGEVSLAIRLWRVIKGTSNENPIESFLASALNGKINITISDIVFDLDIFGVHLTGVRIPAKINIIQSFNLKSMLKPKPKRGAGGIIQGENPINFDVVDTPANINIFGGTAQFWIKMRLYGMQIPIYYAYLEMDFYMDDDPVFGLNDSLYNIDQESGIVGPYLVKSQDRNEYLPNRIETPRIKRINSLSIDSSSISWFGGGCIYDVLESDVIDWGGLFGAKQAFVNYYCDQSYNDETQKKDDCEHNYILYKGYGDSLSIAMAHIKIEFLILWWVIDLYVPEYFMEISADLNQNIAIGLVPGMENYDFHDGKPDATEYWIDPWANLYVGDGCGYH